MARIGVALGGGGARGLAHVGVLKVLDREGLSPKVIAGTSMGAFIGGLYASGIGGERLEGLLYQYLKGENFSVLKNDFIRSMPPKRHSHFLRRLHFFLQAQYLATLGNVRISYISQETVNRSILPVIPDVRIEDMVCKFCAVTADLSTGEEMVVRTGPLRDAILGSIAAPGFFPPRRTEDGAILVDGGVTSPVPVNAAFTMGADVVVAIDVSEKYVAPGKITGGLEIIECSNEIRARVLRTNQTKDADVLVHVELGSLHWTDFRYPEVCVHAGEKAIVAALPAIRRACRKAWWLGGLRRMVRGWTGLSDKKR